MITEPSFVPSGTMTGGDGTLNRFINDTIPLRTDCGIYYFATGSGNDFLADIGGYYR